MPVADQIIHDLEGHSSKSASVLFVTIWELGEAFGPLFTAPLSAVYGRYIVFNVANVFFIIGIMITALSQGTNLLIVSRFLTGCAVASNVLMPSIIGDMFPPESRGSAMSACLLAPLLGGAIGPAIAGAIAESMGWRPIMWIALALATGFEIAFSTFFTETYKLRILQRREIKLRKEKSKDGSLSDLGDAEPKGTSSTLWRSMARPMNIFISSIVLQALALWGAVIFTFFYVMSITLPEFLRKGYGFSAAATGSAFLMFSESQ